MRTLICIVTLLTVHSTAGGQPKRFAAQDQYRGLYLDTESNLAAPRSTGGNCAPERAEPIWGHDSNLIGYECVPESANGG